MPSRVPSGMSCRMATRSVSRFAGGLVTRMNGRPGCGKERGLRNRLICEHDGMGCRKSGS